MAEMHEDEYYRIALLEATHWWYRSLHNLVLKTIKENFNEKNITLIDAGCGTGGLMDFLKKNDYSNIKGFDISPIAVKLCIGKRLEVFQGDLNNVSSLFDANYADVIIANDNLYFLNEGRQRTVTNAMHGILKKDGLIIANLPALAAFRGLHDVQVGIGGRYNKNKIRITFDADKYRLIKAIYWPFFLSFPIWLIRSVQRIKMRLNKSTPVRSDLKSNSRIVNSLLFVLTDFENKIFNRKPFGSSLFLVMRAKTL